jgi:hypothetical protein
MAVARYGAGADISTGSGATNSCLSIIDTDIGEKVAEVATPDLEPSEFAALSVALCNLFRDSDGAPPLLAWEQQGPGGIYGKRVRQYGYTNVFFTARDIAFVRSRQVSENPGWNSTTEGFRLLIEEYRSAIQSRQVINRSDAALRECLNFCYDGRGQPIHSQYTNTEDLSGARENHGDLVIADALAWKMCLSMGLGKAAIRVEDEIAPLSLAWRRQLHDNAAVARSRY